MYAQLFKEIFELSKENRHRLAIPFGDGTTINNQKAIILTCVEIIPQKLVMRAEIK